MGGELHDLLLFAAFKIALKGNSVLNLREVASSPVGMISKCEAHGERGYKHHMKYLNRLPGSLIEQCKLELIYFIRCN